MSNYVYCHIEGDLPSCLYDSIQSVYDLEPDANIIVVTDRRVVIDRVKLLNVEDIISNETQQVMKMGLFLKDDNPLWRTSVFRVFLVRDALQHLQINSCYHFDNDVLLFEPSYLFEDFLPSFDGLQITRCNSDEVVFGFSKFQDIETINELCKLLHDIVLNIEVSKKYYKTMPNEMQLLGGILKERPDLIKELPTLPTTNIHYIFDPSSYGQYFGGTHQEQLSGWFGEHHNIGQLISTKKLLPIFIKNKPYIQVSNRIYPIVNLHIHSKNTKQFLYKQNKSNFVNLHIENKYPGSEMLPLERIKMHTWLCKIVKPKNDVLEIGTGVGGSTYYIANALKTIKSDSIIHTCDPTRAPYDELLNEFKNIKYYKTTSTELILLLKSRNIKIDFIFFDGPEIPELALNDIKLLENFIDAGCYFAMHDWEICQRKYDNAVSQNSLYIRQYIENSNVWEKVEVLDGKDYDTSVGLCLYKYKKLL